MTACSCLHNNVGVNHVHVYFNIYSISIRVCVRSVEATLSVANLLHEVKITLIYLMAPCDHVTRRVVM